MLNKDKPIAIGGVGGSGTRLFAQIMYVLGVYMGGCINDTDDNLWFTLLFKRKESLKITYKKFNTLFNIFEKAMIGDTRLTNNEKKILEKIYHENTKQNYLYSKKDAYNSLLNVIKKNYTNYGAGWGWKEPNTYVLISELLKRYPKMKYIHVMRNGLDMAFSPNFNQLKFWTNLKPTASNSLHMWVKVHKRLFEIQLKYPNNIMIIKYEDFN